MDVRVSAEELMLLNCGVGEDSWESLGLQGDPPVHPKRNQSWIFIGRTDAEAETPILWPPDAKNWLTRKDSNAGEDCRQEKGATEDEMVGWHHWLTDMSLSRLWELVMDKEACVLQSMGSRRVGPDRATELNCCLFISLCWAFVAAQGLSLVVASGSTLPCGAHASHCSGFSCCGAQALGTRTSVAAVLGLGSCSLWAR